MASMLSIAFATLRELFLFLCLSLCLCNDFYFQTDSDPLSIKGHELVSMMYLAYALCYYFSVNLIQIEDRVHFVLQKTLIYKIINYTCSGKAIILDRQGRVE